MVNRNGSSPSNWALSLVVGLVVALVLPWIFGLIMMRRVRRLRQNEIDKDVQGQLAAQNKNN